MVNLVLINLAIQLKGSSLALDFYLVYKESSSGHHLKTSFHSGVFHFEKRLFLCIVQNPYF
jgi:hypothetical protein